MHDVWVHDGIAYEAGRTDGLIVFDVGGGDAGGAPNNPVEIARIPQLTGWNHSAWPFTSPSTGKRYVLGGDEAFYRHPLAPESGGINWREKLPSRAKGWIHFVDITDPGNPVETARYQVPESGPHNYWIDEERELLYIGHFDAGLRVVDISGELLGDLYRQGREVAHFFTDDPAGLHSRTPRSSGGRSRTRERSSSPTSRAACGRCAWPARPEPTWRRPPRPRLRRPRTDRTPAARP